jgi:hypothetical protein
MRRWEHLAGVGAGGQQRVVAELAGVAVAGATLVVAVDLTDGGVHIDGHRRLAGSGTGCPCPGQDGLGDPIELADVAEGEGAQERPQRRWRQHPMAQQLGGLGGAEHIGVVDAVRPGHHGVQQREDLAAGSVMAGAITEVDQLIDQLLDAQPVGEGGGQQQSGIGDGVVVVEAGGQPVWTVGG